MRQSEVEESSKRQLAAGDWVISLNVDCVQKCLKRGYNYCTDESWAVGYCCETGRCEGTLKNPTCSYDTNLSTLGLYLCPHR